MKRLRRKTNQRKQRKRVRKGVGGTSREKTGGSLEGSIQYGVETSFPSGVKDLG